MKMKISIKMLGVDEPVKVEGELAHRLLATFRSAIVGNYDQVVAVIDAATDQRRFIRISHITMITEEEEAAR